MPRPLRLVSTGKSAFASSVPTRTFSCCSASFAMSQSRDLYDYTSGKWLWNNALRHAERHRTFNASGLKSLAAAAVNRPVKDVISFEKLAEGGFNRTFLLSMCDGFQMIARIPYTTTKPTDLLVASEVATIDYLRTCNIPVPAIYGYSTHMENSARTEYIFMEVMQGRSLGDIWYDLSENARIKVVEGLVNLESQLFSLGFPAGGSIFYTKDLDSQWDRVQMSSNPLNSKDTFCIGPDLTLSLWYGKRESLSVFRGPYREVQEALATGAQKEISYLTEYGRPLHPIQQLHRECYDFQQQSPIEHMKLLHDYLQILQYIKPQSAVWLQPKIRHPDLQPNNIFVSDDLQITGLIDWQHSAILPLFLQGGIPRSLQNYGDEVSESLDFPTLPEDFENMDESAQIKQVQLLRERQLHYYYVKKTMELCPIHGEVLIDPLCILSRKLFSHSSDPWEGDNVTLKGDLIDFTQAWSTFAQHKPTPACPITFSEAEQQECFGRATAIQEADTQFHTCLDLVGAGPEGWLPTDHYDNAQLLAQQLLADTLEHAESDEARQQIQEHWLFNDFDEDEYF